VAAGHGEQAIGRRGAFIQSVNYPFAESMDVLAELVQILWNIHRPFRFQRYEKNRSRIHAVKHNLVLQFGYDLVLLEVPLSSRIKGFDLLESLLELV